MNKTEVFIRKNEKRVSKEIYKTFQKQRKEFVNILKTEKKSYELKGITEDIMDFINSAKEEIATALPGLLQNVMQGAYKKAYEKVKNYIPGYKPKLIFNIETEPAVIYLKELKKLHLSNKDGSIGKTTQEQILTILQEGIKLGKNYTDIGKEIQALEPFVFSESRAKLIAIQETGQAYGWANFEPYKSVVAEGYEVQKKWVTSHDDKVRQSHIDNQSEGWIPFEQNWGGTGDQYAPSKQFRCRCTSSFKIVG